MGRIKKKGTSGQAKNFITRSQAIRKLQISLPDFRRLCIFKGCYPREPRNKKKVSKFPTSTFYYTKDIQYLLHEPLLDKFRDHKALAKKIAKALGRGEVGDAARLEKKNKPRISLDHIIKERYPTFVDALRDLDDALSMLFLFANLPATSTVLPKTISLCQRLCHEFQHYLITTHSLRKSFLSIKGIYYQATIQGQDILWLVPYKFVQRVTQDVDYRIMGTFIEFYAALLGFINFRLYSSIGLIYPPKFNAQSDSDGGELSAFILEGRAVDSVPIDAVPSNSVSEPDPDLQRRVDDMDLSHQPNLDIEPDQNEDPSHTEATAEVDTFVPTAPDADTLPQPSQPSTDLATLFSSLSVFLSRETPRHPLEFLLRAFGCKRVSWDAVLGDGAFTTDEFDPSITHQIVDRPPLASTSEISEQEQRKRMLNRTYVQPQWVWDCVNEGRLLRPDLYAPGATLPPHLSPWVKPSKGAYDPTAPLEIQEREGEAEEALLQELEDEDDGVNDQLENAVDGTEPAIAGAMDVDSETEHANGNGMSIAAADSDTDTASEKSTHSSFGGFSEHSDAGSDTSASRHQRELEAEAAGLTFTDPKAAPKGILKNTSQTEADMRKRQALAKKRKANDEEILEGRKMMMSRKARKLYDRAEHGNENVERKAAKLRQKRRKLEGRSEGGAMT